MKDEFEEYLIHEIKEWVISAEAGSTYAMQVASALMDAKSRYIKIREDKNTYI